MPIFGYGSFLDFIFLLLPFICIAIVNLFLTKKIPVAAVGFIIIGIFCMVTKTVEYKTIRQEGLVAVFVGLFYVIIGIACFVLRYKNDKSGH